MQRLLWVLPALFNCLGAAAQTGLSPCLDSVADRFHVVRNVPEGFQFREEFTIVKFDTLWRKHRELGGIWMKGKGITGVVGALLQSDDRQCAVIYDVIDIYQFNGRGSQRWMHRSLMLNYLLAQLGTADFRYEDHVSVVAGREARRRFGADSIFTFEVPVKPQTLAGETYTRCAMLYLSRKDRAYLGFTFFFTDEGYERRAEYLSALDGAVWYKRGRWRHKPEQVVRAEQQNKVKR